MSILPGFEALFGNEEQKSYFSAKIAAGTLSHTYILEGPKGSGKHTLALCALYALALWEKSPFASKIPALCSPDVKLLGIPEKKKSIGVDSVRLLRREAILVPGELPFRAFLIEDAGAMTAAAQNAALKILEEPPAGVYFFLLSENAGALLPTVRSRAATIRTERFSEAALRQFALGLQVPQISSASPRFDKALRYADGCIGPLLEALNADNRAAGDKKSAAKGKSREEKAQAILSAAAAKDPRILLPAILSLSPAKESPREDLDGILACLEKALRDILLVRSGADLPLVFYPTKEDAASAGRPFTEKALLLLRDTVTARREKLMAGAALTLFKTELAAAMGKAARA